MLGFSRESFVDVDKYDERINGRNYVLMDKEKFKSISEYIKIRMESSRKLAITVMDAESGHSFISMSKNAVIDFLQKIKHCPESDFSIKSTDSDSLNADKVLTPLMNRGYAVEFLEAYISYKSLMSIYGRTPAFLSCMEYHGEVDREGNKLYRVYYSVRIQENRRFNYKNQDLISTPSEYKTTFGVEDGYCLVWGDFKQSDFRIAINVFLADENNTEALEKYPDRYRSMAELIAAIDNKEFDLADFIAKRELYKLNSLATLYGTVNSKNPAVDEVVKQMSKFYKTCSRYVEYLRRVENRIELGLTIEVEDYFGFKQLIPVNPKFPNSTKNKALNTPIQTGTSNIMILTVNKILDMFYERGYTEDDVSVYMCRHDEPIFRVKESAMKDAWIFKNAQRILVDDWTELEMEFSYGYNYLVEDAELTKLAHESYDANEEEIVERNGKHFDFYPVKDVFVCSVGYRQVGDKMIVVLYHSYTNKAKSFILSDPKVENVLPHVIARLSEVYPRIKEEGYDGIIIRNDIKSGEFYDPEENVFFRISNASHKDPGMAQALAFHVASKIARKNNIKFEHNDSFLEINKKFISGVGELDVFKKEN